MNSETIPPVAPMHGVVTQRTISDYFDFRLDANHSDVIFTNMTSDVRKSNQNAKGNTMYEVNANGNKSFRNASAKKVAEVAVTWKKNGFEPKAYAINEVDGKVTVSEAAVTTIAATAKALANAK